MADETSNSAPNPDSNLLEFATELTIAWLSNPNTRVAAEDVPAFLQSMHGAVQGLVAAPEVIEEQAAPASEYTPAVSVRRSLLSKDHIISMIDGKPYKALKRHLSTHGLTPAEYRERYRLKADYPMVAENYAAMRRDMAKRIGLGRKPGAKTAPKTAAPKVAAPKAAAPKAAAPKAAAMSAAKSEAIASAAPKPAPRTRKAAPAKTSPGA